MNEQAIGVNQFLARIPNPLSKSLDNKFNLVLRVFLVRVIYGKHSHHPI